MRHEQIKETATYRKVEMAAWPSSLQPVPILPAAEAEAAPQQATPSVPDVPAAVGKLIIGSYVTMLGAFALATIASSYSVYMITISALFLVAYFSVPWIFLRQERSNGVSRPSFDRFLAEGMMTQTGHSSGSAVLVQMMVVPVLLTFGVAAIGIAAAIIL